MVRFHGKRVEKDAPYFAWKSRNLDQKFGPTRGCSGIAMPMLPANGEGKILLHYRSGSKELA